MRATELTYDENAPRDRELFAETVFDLQQRGAKFTTHRAHGILTIAIETEGGEQ